ncbi:hypothetical protein M8542_43720 [Amycolatopsis sp. OK19-0408]|uniref:Uncharacterized protein n=1 Tax=Amycolatopsis iheyensis TaxID=2945988 RepID=A0A9X2SP59_9PSEU|nr:hypothetical protein [Amycolatopsis iheyensis]MCR6489742.1 hypothetical protein [Amycolatopsis iheyensis]
MRTWLAALLLLTAGCSTTPEVACPAIGTRVGIGLTVPQPAGITRATLEACWGDQCVTRPADLRPDDATGGLQGFADVPGLQAEPIRVTVRFDDGKPHTTVVTPAFSEPGGPACGQAGPQAQLVAGADREVRPR